MLLRRSTFAHIHHVVASGFEAGFDVRHANTSVEVQHSIFGANLVRQVAYEEGGSNTTDQKDEGDDGFFDPSAKFVRAFRDANDHGAADSWVVWGAE